MEEFFQLLNVHRVSDVREMEIHTAEPIVPLVVSRLRLFCKAENI
jgi:hypothetical protein